MNPGISNEQLKIFKHWFDNYTSSFFSNNQKMQQNIELKIEHTYKVCEMIQGLASSLDLSKEGVNLAEAIALFHDIGRYQQYKTYGTFSDSRSVNHGELGATILLQEGILNQLDGLERVILQKSVRYHNRKILPSDENEFVNLFCKMIRDADKLDIFRVVVDYYENQMNQERNETVELDLPDDPDLTESVIEDLRKHHPVDMKHLRTLNDFKMIQIGWVYDMNFGYSLHIMIEKDYLSLIRNELPKLDVVDEIVQDAKLFLKAHCQEILISDPEFVSN